MSRLPDLRARAGAQEEAAGRARLRIPRPGERLDAGLGLVLAGLLAGGIAGGALLASWSSVSALFEPPLAAPVEDRRILRDYRDNPAPMVDLLEAGGAVLIGRQDGGIDVFDPAGRRFSAEALPRGADRMAGAASGPAGSPGSPGSGSGAPPLPAGKSPGDRSPDARPADDSLADDSLDKGGQQGRDQHEDAQQADAQDGGAQGGGAQDGGGPLTGELALLAADCEAGDCARAPVHAVTREGGLARRTGRGWEVVLGDQAFRDAAGAPVAQEEIRGWAVSDDGALVLLDAGVRGFALFDQRDGSWQLLPGRPGPLRGPLFFRGAFWFGGTDGIHRIPVRQGRAGPPEGPLSGTAGEVLDLALSADDGLLALVSGACAAAPARPGASAPAGAAPAPGAGPGSAGRSGAGEIAEAVAESGPESEPESGPESGPETAPGPAPLPATGAGQGTAPASGVRSGAHFGAHSGDCLSLLRLDPGGSAVPLWAETDRHPALQDADLLHIGLQGSDLVAVGPAGIHRYDSRARRWSVLAAGTPTAVFAETDARRIHVGLEAGVGGALLTIADARILGRTALDQPLTRILPGTGTGVFALDRAGRVLSVPQPGATLRILAPADAGAPVTARFTHAAALGDLFVALGPEGVLQHDITARRYAFTPAAALPPLPLADAIVLAGRDGRIWIVSRRDGDMVSLRPGGDFPARALQFEGHGGPNEPIAAARAVNGGLDLVTVSGGLWRLNVARGNALEALTGPGLPGTLRPVTMAADGAFHVFSDGPQLWAYDFADRGWRGPQSAPPGAGAVTDLALVRGAVLTLGASGMVHRLTDAGWSPVSGGPDRAAFAAGAVEDAMTGPGGLFLAAGNRVQAYLPGERRFGALWEVPGRAARLLSASGPEPLWTNSAGIHQGGETLFGGPDFAGGWLGGSGPVALGSAGGRLYIAGAGGCLYRGAPPPEGAPVDVVPLDEGRFLVRTGSGAGIYEPGLRRWLRVSGFGPGSGPGQAPGGGAGRLHNLGGHLVWLGPAGLASVPVAAIPRPGSCEAGEVSLRWELTAAGIDTALVDGAPEVLLLGADGSIARWAGGALREAAPAPGEAPASETLLRAYPARSGGIDFVSAAGIHHYALPARSWSLSRFVGLPGGVARIDVIDGSAGQVVSAWDREGGLWAGLPDGAPGAGPAGASGGGGSGAGTSGVGTGQGSGGAGAAAGSAPGGAAGAAATITFTPVQRPVLPELPLPPATILDMAIAGERIAILGARQLLLYPPQSAAASASIALPQARAGYSLATDASGELLLLDGEPAAPLALYRLEMGLTGAHDLAAVAARYLPGSDLAYAFSAAGGGVQLLRIDSAQQSWACRMLRGAEPGCTLLAASPMALAPGEVAGWDPLTRTLLTTGTDAPGVWRLDAASRPLGRIAGPQLQPQGAVFSSGPALLYWEGPGRALWRLDNAAPGARAEELLPAAVMLRAAGRHHVVWTGSEVLGLEDGRLLRPVLPQSHAGEELKRGLYTEAGPVLLTGAGRAVAGGGRLVSDPLIRFDPEVLAVLPLRDGAEWLALEPGGVLSRIGTGSCPLPDPEPESLPGSLPEGFIGPPPAAVLPEPRFEPCMTRAELAFRLDPGEMLMDLARRAGPERAELHLRTSQRELALDAVSGDWLRSSFPRQGNDLRLTGQLPPGGLRQVNGRSWLNPPELRESEFIGAGPQRIGIRPLSAVPLPAFDAGWIGWERSAGRVRINAAPQPLHLAPAEALQGGLFLPMLPARGAVLADGSYAWVNAAGLWHQAGGRMMRVAELPGTAATAGQGAAAGPGVGPGVGPGAGIGAGPDPASGPDFGSDIGTGTGTGTDAGVTGTADGADGAAPGSGSGAGGAQALPIALDQGVFLWPGRGIAARDGAAGPGLSPRSFARGALMLGSDPAANRVSAALEVAGRAQPAFAARGFLHDQRRSVTGRGRALLALTPAGLVPAGALAGILPVPAGAERIEAERGRLFALTPQGWFSPDGAVQGRAAPGAGSGGAGAAGNGAEGGGGAGAGPEGSGPDGAGTDNSGAGGSGNRGADRTGADGTSAGEAGSAGAGAGGAGWAPSDSPFLTAVLLTENGRVWERRAGAITLRSELAGEDWRLARQGLEFDSDRLLGFAATPGAAVAVSRAGTHAAADYRGLRAPAPPAAPAPAGTRLDAARPAPQLHLLYAEGPGGFEVWDSAAQAWRPPAADERPWDERLAASIDGITAVFRVGPRFTVDLETLAGARVSRSFDWGQGEPMPFDRALALHADPDGEGMLIGTAMGLRRLQRSASGYTNAALILPDGAGQAGPAAVQAIGRPEAAPGRIEIVFAGGACLETASVAGRLSPCAAPPGLAERYVARTPFWRWSKGPASVAGAYLLEDGSERAIGQPLRGALPHDLLADRLSCGAWVAELWQAGGILRLGERLHAVPGVSGIDCLAAPAQLDGGQRLEPGLYALTGAGALHLGAGGFTPAGAAAAGALAMRRDGRVALEAGRLRYGVADGALRTEVLSLAGTWGPTPWSGGRLLLDQPRALGWNGGLQLIGDAGVIPAPAGRVDPARLVVMDGAAPGALAACSVRSAEVLDGRSHGLAAAPGAPLRLYCADGSWLEGISDGSRDLGSFAPVAAGASQRRLVDVPGLWEISRAVPAGGGPGPLSITFRGEQARLTAGRFDFDSFRALAAPFAGRTELLTDSGWWRAPSGVPGLAGTARPQLPLDPRSITGLSRDLSRRDGAAGLCLTTGGVTGSGGAGAGGGGSGLGGAAQFWSGGAGLETVPFCRELRGRDALWDWWERRPAGGAGPQAVATALALNGIPLERRLEAGRFADLIVDGAPMRGSAGQLYVPSRLGVLVLNGGDARPGGILAFDPGGILVRAGDGGVALAGRSGPVRLEGAVVAGRGQAGTGAGMRAADRPDEAAAVAIFPVSAGELACPALAALAQSLPAGLRLLRAAPAGEGYRALLIEGPDGRLQALLDCSGEGQVLPWSAHLDVAGQPRNRALGGRAMTAIDLSLEAGRLRISGGGRELEVPGAMPRALAGMLIRQDGEEILVTDGRGLWSIPTPGVIAGLMRDGLPQRPGPAGQGGSAGGSGAGAEAGRDAADGRLRAGSGGQGAPGAGAGQAGSADQGRAEGGTAGSGTAGSAGGDSAGGDSGSAGSGLAGSGGAGGGGPENAASGSGPAIRGDAGNAGAGAGAAGSGESGAALPGSDPPPRRGAAPVPAPVPPPASAGSAADEPSYDAARVQRALAAALSRRLGADGIIGPQSRRAIADWQALIGSAPTGYLSSAQLELLLEGAANDG